MTHTECAWCGVSIVFDPEERTVEKCGPCLRDEERAEQEDAAHAAQDANAYDRENDR